MDRIKIRIALWVTLAWAAVNVACGQVPAPVVYAEDIDSGGTDLRAVVVEPITPGQVPAVVIEHGGRFKNGRFITFGIVQDIANAGYLAIAAERRLAPPHTQMTAACCPGDGQKDPPSEGHADEQLADIQRAIRYARSLPKCNGQVAFIGFSGAGGQGAMYAINGMLGDDKLDALVSCSGPFDLYNADILGQPPERQDIENYLDHTTDEGQPFIDAAKAASAYWQAIPPGTTPCPFYGVNSTSEVIPDSELTTWVAKLVPAGGVVESTIRTGPGHATEYWNLGCDAPGCGPGAFPTVKQAVIDFLQRQMPSGATSGTGFFVLRWKGATDIPPATLEIYGQGTNAAGNTDLFWNTMVHPGATDRPVGLLIHIGNFRAGQPGPNSVALDIYNAGYNVAIIEHRLADPGREMRNAFNNQPVDDHGLFPEQTDDVSLAIIAARNGTTPSLAGRVTGKVFAVGGDSGASHAAWFAAAADHGGDKLDAAVLVSGAYDLHDEPTWTQGCNATTLDDFKTYVGCDPGTITPPLGLYYLWPSWRNGPAPDPGLCNGLINPYCAGILWRQTWKMLEPTGPTPDFAYLDACVAASDAANRDFSFQIIAGTDTPPYIFAAPYNAPNFPAGVDLEPTTVPWDPVVQTEWERVQTAMAARYKSDPHCKYVLIQGVGHASETFFANTDDEFDAATAVAVAAGYANVHDAWRYGCQWYIDMMVRVWAPIPVVLTTGLPFSPENDGAADLHAMYDYGLLNHPGGFGARGNDLNHSGPQPTDTSAQVVSQLSASCIGTGFQFGNTQLTNDPNPPDWLNQSFVYAVTYGAHFVEMFANDIDDATSPPALQYAIDNLPGASTGCGGNGGLFDLASPYRRFGPLSSPVIVFNTSAEQMPARQYTNFINRLTLMGAPFDANSRLITEPPFRDGCTRHAFQTWRAGGSWPDQIKTDSLAFLAATVPPP